MDKNDFFLLSGRDRDWIAGLEDHSIRFKGKLKLVIGQLNIGTLGLLGDKRLGTGLSKKRNIIIKGSNSFLI